MRISCLITGVLFISVDMEISFSCISAQNSVDFVSKYSSLVKFRFSLHSIIFFNVNHTIIFTFCTAWLNPEPTILKKKSTMEPYPKLLCWIHHVFMDRISRFFKDEISASLILCSFKNLSLHLACFLQILSSAFHCTCCNSSLSLFTDIFKWLSSWKSFSSSAWNVAFDCLFSQEIFLHASSSFLYRHCQ